MAQAYTTPEHDRLTSPNRIGARSSKTAGLSLVVLAMVGALLAGCGASVHIERSEPELDPEQWRP